MADASTEKVTEDPNFKGGKTIALERSVANMPLEDYYTIAGIVCLFSAPHCTRDSGMAAFERSVAITRL